MVRDAHGRKLLANAWFRGISSIAIAIIITVRILIGTMTIIRVYGPG